MRKTLLSAFLAILVAGCLSGSLRAADSPAPSLKVGDTAPQFKLPYFDGTDLKYVTLDQYRGKKNVVLAFYVFAFTGG